MIFPTPLFTGNNEADVQGLMLWAQNIQFPVASTTNVTRSLTTPFTVLATDHTIFMTINADHDVVMLPPIQSNWVASSPIYSLIKVDATGFTANITAPTGKTINGLAFKTAPSTQYARYDIYSDGAAYYITASNPL